MIRAVGALLAWIFLANPVSAFALQPCEKGETQLLALTSRRRLYICDDGKKLGTFSIALGRGGLYKKREGDKKTPIGIYTLGTPVSSSRYGIFVPVNYPNAQDIERGFTGSSIGIHGPDRNFLWLGFMSTWFNWTKGCVAVASDRIMQRLSEWIRLHPQASFVIKDDRK